MQVLPRPLAASLVSLVLAAPAWGGAIPPRYQVSVIGGGSDAAGPKAESRPQSINNNGRVVGWSYGDGERMAPLNWKTGFWMDLSGPQGFDRTISRSVNILGRVAGGSQRLDWQGNIVESRALKWVGGQRVDLGTLGGSVALGMGINDQDVVVGYSSTAGEASMRAFVHRGGSMTALPMPYGMQESYAYDVSNSGHIAGFAANATSTRAVLWQGGVGRTLRVPADVRASAAHAVNDYGQAVGTYEIGVNEGTYAAALWFNGVLLNLGNLGGGAPYAVAQDINNLAQVVGTSLSPTGLSGFLWQQGQMYDLRDLLLEGRESLQILSASAINDKGMIVASALVDGRQTAVLLTPIISGIPAPGALGLLILAGVAAARRRR